jgi:hypothetical protein
MADSFPRAAELMALAALYAWARDTGALVDLDDSEDVRAWLPLPDVCRGYDVPPDVILVGLEAYAACGVIRLARGDDGRGEVYAELRRDARNEPGYGPWSVRYGVRLRTCPGSP